jgi:hypothetical protein
MAERITLRRTKGWRLPPNTRVVTRATIFGNPFKVGDPGRLLTREVDYALRGPADPAQAVLFFQTWLATGAHPWPANDLTYFGRAALRIELDARRAAILAALPSLRGQNLACFCKAGAPCHADVLIRMGNE